MRRAAEQTEKDGLQHVLGIGRVAGDAIRGAEDQAVMRTEGALEFVRYGDRRFLFYQYASQGTPPCSSVSLVKTAGEGDYYMRVGDSLSCWNNELRAGVRVR